MLTHRDIFPLQYGAASTNSDRRFYALIDHAGMPGLAKKLTTMKTQWISLFAGSKDEGALSVAPLLIQIDTDQNSFKRRTLLNWICEQGTYTCSILFMSSPLSMPELARRLAVRLDANLQKNIEIVLRFFDGRIIEQLIAILSDEQKAAFLNVAHRWWYVDRHGQLQRIDAEFSETDTHDLPLTFTETQESALLDASEPDQVAEMLKSGVPNENQNLPPGSRHDLIVRYIAAARMAGI